MPQIHRLIGIAGGGVDPQALEIKFDIATDGGAPLSCIMKYGAATQIIGALGRMFSALQEFAQKQKGRMEAVASEQIAAAHIQKDRFSGLVIFQVTTPAGIPYNFEMPSQVASDIADRLKTESGKSHQVGTA
jgi:hypothetical protein